MAIYAGQIGNFQQVNPLFAGNTDIVCLIIQLLNLIGCWPRVCDWTLGDLVCNTHICSNSFASLLIFSYIFLYNGKKQLEFYRLHRVPSPVSSLLSASLVITKISFSSDHLLFELI
jgi:hypothetical protein